MASRTIVYIDGFNLYYGALKGTPYKWLDLEALSQRLLPKDTITQIRYFTARVSARPGDLQQPQRQQTYLRALGTQPLISVHYGHFLSHTVRMPLANPRPTGPRTAQVVKTEEKGSDVNLASHLLLDAFRNDCEVAVVVSNDSDLRVPIRIAEHELGIVVGIVNRHRAKYRSRVLTGTFFKQLRSSILGRCQTTGGHERCRRGVPQARSLVTPETQRPAEAGLAPNHRSDWGDIGTLSSPLRQTIRQPTGSLERREERWLTPIPASESALWLSGMVRRAPLPGNR